MVLGTLSGLKLDLCQGLGGYNTSSPSFMDLGTIKCFRRC